MCLTYSHRPSDTTKLINNCEHGAIFSKECIVGYKLFSLGFKGLNKKPRKLRNMWNAKQKCIFPGWTKNEIPFRVEASSRYPMFTLSTERGQQPYPCGLHIFVDPEKAQELCDNLMEHSHSNEFLVVVPVNFFKEDVLCSGRQDKCLYRSKKEFAFPVRKKVSMMKVFVTKRYFIKAKDHKKAVRI